MNALHYPLAVAALCLTCFAANADDGYEPAEYLPKEQYRTDGGRDLNDDSAGRQNPGLPRREAPTAPPVVANAAQPDQPALPAANSDGAPATPLILGVLAMIGILAYRRKRRSPAAIGGESVATEEEGGTPTGVERYIESTLPQLTGVARYLQRHAASEPLTGVAKYLIRQKLGRR